jgi:hypothetical protein
MLALRMDYTRATEIAARVGRGFALVFGVVGLLYNPFLVLIALFIWVSAAAESAELHQRSARSGVQVNRLMIRDVRTLAPSETLNDALRHVLTGFQHDFPVVDGDKVVGVLPRAALLAALAKSGAESRVAAAMTPPSARRTRTSRSARRCLVFAIAVSNAAGSPRRKPPDLKRLPNAHARGPNEH